MDAQSLWDIEQIKQLKARYFRCMDKKLWEEFAQVIARDAVFGSRDASLRGRAAIVEYIKQQCEGVRSVHLGHTPEIEILGDGRARGTWALADFLEEEANEGEPRGFRGYGHYHETYVFEEGQWRIETMKLSRIRIDPLPGGFPPVYEDR